ncbi:unnamed protein product [Ilex paraguariensis]|uniref:Uncharacterized protein n=1 Tax=Ilex paraguariensis TaxID=185542 RepID=A0ABC8V1I0_9AQUA
MQEDECTVHIVDSFLHSALEEGKERGNISAAQVRILKQEVNDTADIQFKLKDNRLQPPQFSQNTIQANKSWLQIALSNEHGVQKHQEPHGQNELELPGLKPLYARYQNELAISQLEDMIHRDKESLGTCRGEGDESFSASQISYKYPPSAAK